MPKAKRKRNLDSVEANRKLLNKVKEGNNCSSYNHQPWRIMMIFSDPDKVPAYVPTSFISRSSALRNFRLKEEVIFFNMYTSFLNLYFKDLITVEQAAVYGVRKGQKGVFYHPTDIIC